MLSAFFSIPNIIVFVLMIPMAAILSVFLKMNFGTDGLKAKAITYSPYVLLIILGILDAYHKAS